jgi:type IV pilus assembly protein PilB
MTSDQLLQELRSRDLLAEDAVQKIKREVLVSDRSAEDIIDERRLLPSERIAEVKSQIFNIPYQKVELGSYDDALLKLVPEETVRTYGLVPLAKQDGLLVAGMLQPDDVKAQEALKFIARRERLNLGVYIVSRDDWQKILRKYSPYKTGVEAVVSAMNLKAGAGRKLVSLEEAAGNEEAPIIKIVADTFKEAVQSRASDIHIEPQLNYLRIRFRVDGDLKEAASLPAELIQPVTSRVKVISNLKIDETRIPQDGRFRSKILDREIDFRVATFPTPLGEKVAIRILDPSTGLKGFDQLGLAGQNLEKVKRGLEKPYGMVLVTGPTGSGKSTTLYSLLQTLNDESVNIVSLEDPVEYFVSGTNQSQVRPEIGYDFASGLRQILRQDPDVIMVGEVRDSETAGLAVQAALTGHVVLSTLHTNNAAGVIPRLLDMKVDLFLLPVSLNIIVAQRLVGLLCSSCKVAEEAPENISKTIAKSLAAVPAADREGFAEPYKIYHAPGCSECRGKGVTGRIAVFEVLEMTQGLQEVVNSGPTLQKIAKEAAAQHMLTMRQDGILKALRGLVSVEDVLRATEEYDDA